MRPLVSKIALAVAAFGVFLAAQAKADVVRQDSAETMLGLPTPVYMWQNPDQKPRAVAIAIHGLVMHGGVYDSLARRLADEGIIVLAPDLRGYGRWQTGHIKDSKLDYEQSYKDVNALVKATKNRYPNLPLYCIGESLGAGLAMHVASDQPLLVDGLVLSSPALKLRKFVGQVIAETPGLIVHGLSRQINLVPYIKQFASEDPQIVEGCLQDPLVRKHLTTMDLVRTRICIRPNLVYAKRIPTKMPVLIMQGDKDRMLKSNAVVQLLARLKSTDQTVRWFNDRGHVLLETGYMRPETVQTVTGWLYQHIQEAQPTQVSVVSQSDTVSN